VHGSLTDATMFQAEEQERSTWCTTNSYICLPR